MSLLAPLYFLGALAVSLPILFHLIRRRPRGQVEFSTLMFLRPSPPRLTRRSRLDNWLLLLIRALALLLIAAAFTRPFLRSEALSDLELPGRRLVLMIDTSASMQRAGLWQQVVNKANTLIDDLQPADRMAIVAYDSKPKTLLGFEQFDGLSLPQRRSTAKKLIADLRPGWQATDLGEAISFAGDLAATYEADDPSDNQTEVKPENEPSRGLTGPAQLVLISDMQRGADLESLQVYAWPDDLRLDVQRVLAKDRTNASVSILPTNLEADADERDDSRVRVRVANSEEATESRFQIGWAFAGEGQSEDDRVDEEINQSLPVQVPPGQSRIVRVPRPSSGMNALRLSGDDQSFDNMYYVVAPEPRSTELLSIGADREDPKESLFYYLQRVPLDTPWRTVQVIRRPAAALPADFVPRKTPLIVLSEAVDDAAAARLREYVSAGGQLLVVLPKLSEQAPAALEPLARTVNQIAETELRFSEAEVDDYAMFSQIDFTHRFFRPMQDPKFNDFTQIRFWNHRSIDGLDDSWRRAAAFDDGDPAIIEKSLGQGSVAILASGWQPANSQLAMSTKFIPLVFSMFRKPGQRPPMTAYEVGQPLTLEPSQTATLTLFSGSEVPYRSAADADVIDRPGIYRFEDGEEAFDFAVNLSAAESDTTPIDEGQLERFGAILGEVVDTQQARQQQRQLRDQELESQQRLWQWLLVAAIVLLGLETILGRRQSHRADSAASGSAEPSGSTQASSPETSFESQVGTQV